MEIIKYNEHLFVIKNFLSGAAKSVSLKGSGTMKEFYTKTRYWQKHSGKKRHPACRPCFSNQKLQALMNYSVSTGTKKDNVLRCMWMGALCVTSGKEASLLF